MFFSALDQFDISALVPMFIFNSDLSITNCFLEIVLVAMVFLFIMIFSDYYLFPTMLQFVFEKVFKFGLEIILNQIGEKGKYYFVFLFFCFMNMLLLNLSSLTPFGFSVTSHMILTLYLSLSLCFGIFITGFVRFGMKWFFLFVPEVQLVLMPLMMVIEFASYMLRSFSLAMRLSANMLAGHTLVFMIVKVTFVLYTSTSFFFFLLVPSLISILLLEMGVCMLQAYIYLTLVCMYLKDSLILVVH